MKDAMHFRQICGPIRNAEREIIYWNGCSWCTIAIYEVADMTWVRVEDLRRLKWEITYSSWKPIFYTNKMQYIDDEERERCTYLTFIIIITYLSQSADWQIDLYVTVIIRTNSRSKNNKKQSLVEDGGIKGMNYRLRLRQKNHLISGRGRKDGRGTWTSIQTRRRRRINDLKGKYKFFEWKAEEEKEQNQERVNIDYVTKHCLSSKVHFLCVIQY